MIPPRICESPSTVTIQINPGVSANDVSNAIYRLAAAIFETYGECDPASGIRGNGHHHAQKVASFAEQLWLNQGGKP